MNDQPDSGLRITAEEISVQFAVRPPGGGPAKLITVTFRDEEWPDVETDFRCTIHIDSRDIWP